MADSVDVNLRIVFSLEVWDWLDSRKSDRLCSVMHCHSAHKARTFCKIHYLRYIKHGNPLMAFGKQVPVAPFGYKVCMVCLKVLPEDMCKKESKRCKKCDQAYTRDWKRKNPDKTYKYHQNYMKKNPDRWTKYAKKNPELIKRIRARRKALIRGSTIADPISILDLIELHGPNCYLCGIETVRFKRPEFSRYDPCQSHIEHMIPLSRGGTHTHDNLRIACAQCNIAKQDLTVEEYRIKLGE